MGAVFAAYLTTVGLNFYQWYAKKGTFPPPASLAGAAGVYGAIALLARADERLGAVSAWGVTVAAFFVLTDPKESASGAEAVIFGTVPHSVPAATKPATVPQGRIGIK